MALRPLSANELAASPTLFASLMGDAGRSYSTVGQLLAIYRERPKKPVRGQDPVDDMRVARFAEDMASDRWTSDVVLRVGMFDEAMLVIDGIHRSIAYLACVQQGISPGRLPSVHVNC